MFSLVFSFVSCCHFLISMSESTRQQEWKMEEAQRVIKNEGTFSFVIDVPFCFAYRALVPVFAPNG